MPKIKKRIALIIGINQYDNLSHLRNAVHDAEQMYSVLRELKFETDLSCDEDITIVRAHIENFYDKLANELYDLAVVYFAGHGCMANREDCLLLKDAPILESNKDALIRNHSIVVREMVQRMRAANGQVNILILDACRATITRSISSDFEFMQYTKVPYQTLIAFSTGANTNASDGKSGGSPYTESILRHIKEENIPVEQMFKCVRSELWNASEQLSCEYSCLADTISFNYGQLDPLFGKKYIESALRDEEYKADNPQAAMIISELKTFDWNTQGAALIKFRSFLKSLSQNDRFVIGRNILQAAEGNCFKCISEISPTRLSLYQEGNQNYVLDGILYEMYFNHLSEFRKEHIKGGPFLNDIVRLSEDARFVDSFRFIQQELEPYNKSLYYIPGKKDSINIHVLLEKSSSTSEDNANVWMMQKILINGNPANPKSLLFMEPSKSFKIAICGDFDIPMKYARFSFSPSISEDDIIQTREEEFDLNF
jgi:hypothetical protein